jgi:3-methylcrotonyl-CoA carboxylase beta subunit
MTLQEKTVEILEEEEKLRSFSLKKPSKAGRLPARERVKLLLDEDAQFFEIGLWAAYGMYPEWGEFPAAGVITGIGKVSGREAMIIANDPAVKAGAFVPQSVKKVLRAQKIAYECRLPILYLVDSSGVFLPMQDEIFPDEDDFGRIFRNNAILSAEGIPQFAAIMGNCIAGGGYLPVLSDLILMTEGSGLYIAGPALVKAAINQTVDPEELGGAHLHAARSGTVDYVAKDDQECLKKLREFVSFLPHDPSLPSQSVVIHKQEADLVSLFSKGEYDVRKVLAAIFDEGSLLEYKGEFGQTLVASFARLDGIAVGVIGNQRVSTQNGRGEIEIGGVIYSSGAEKAARFILECNQLRLPLIFLQDVVGFMVGKEAEASGIIKNGSKLINALSNSIVPKITCILGNSFGAGHYALGGKAYDPRFLVAWPSAKYAVMGAEQAASTFNSVSKNKGKEPLVESYFRQMDIRYGAARGWVDAIIAPHSTRSVLTRLLKLALRAPFADKAPFHTGVIQT